MIDDRVNLVLKVVGENIRRLRGKVTQVGLARKARVSRSTLQKAENGVSVEFDNIIRIAQALGKNPADLFLTDEDRQEVTYKTKLIMEKLKIT